MHATREQAAAYRKRTRWAAKRFQGYQVLTYPKMCPLCRRRMTFWVKRLGGCFACAVENGRDR